MRKQTKLVAVLSAAALLAIGASMTSFAAEKKGWQEENGEWVYLDSYGDRVTQEWKKSGSYYYYLDEDGVMATNTLVEYKDDTYYVNEQGIKVMDQWVSVENEDGIDVDGKEVDVLWYYFGSAGKAYKATDTDLKTKTVAYAGGDATFVFDQDGHMVSGWTDVTDSKGTTETYYLGGENEGWAVTGWKYLEPREDLGNDDYDDEEWFNFKSTGKMRKNGTAYISGAYYTFDEYGVMENDWYGAATPPAAASGAQAFANGSGALGTGWVLTTAPDDPDGDTHWYYLVNIRDNDGKVARAVPFNYKTGNKYQAKVIKSKTYLFDGNGQMKTGVVFLDGGIEAIENGSKALGEGYYYFSKESGSANGQMVTGRATVEDDGDKYYYHFDKDGKAYTNKVKDGILYGADGKRIAAEDGNSNMPYTVKADIEVVGKGKTIPANTTVIVSSSGKVRTSGSVKIDGERWKVVDSNTYAAEIVTENE